MYTLKLIKKTQNFERTYVYQSIEEAEKAKEELFMTFHPKGYEIVGPFKKLGRPPLLDDKKMEVRLFLHRDVYKKFNFQAKKIEEFLIKSLIISLIILSTITLIKGNTNHKERLAIPNKISGLHIYINSTPVDEYEVLFKLRIYGAKANNYSQLTDYAVKYALRNVAAAEALIFENQGSYCYIAKYK